VSRASTDRDVHWRATSRTRLAVTLAHMRRLHLCASYFSCAPPCCKSRVTLARTDPLLTLTLPVAEAAANWHMRNAYPEQAPWWHAEAILSTLSAFISPLSPPLFSLRLFLWYTHPFRDTGHHLYSDLQTGVAVAPVERFSGASGKLLERLWEVLCP